MADTGTPWLDIDDQDWRASILADLTLYTESTIPRDAELSWRELNCYPNHALIRVRLGRGRSRRDTYLFWRQDEVYPLDWTATPVHDINARALEIGDAVDAEEYLRFYCWAVTGDVGRFFITEQLDDLPFVEGRTLDGDLESRLREKLTPLELSAGADGTRGNKYRFSGPVLYGTNLFSAEFEVDKFGGVDLVDDVPIASDLPVREDKLTSDRYFVLVLKGGQAMSAEDFLAALARGEGVGTEPPADGEDEDFRVRVLGHVDARGRTFPHPIDIARVQFNGDLSFEGAKFECPVTMDRCSFYGQFVLDGARVEGSFAARRLRMGRARHLPGQAADTPRVSARAMQVSGSLDLQGLWALGRVDLGGVRVGADLKLGAIVISTRGNYGWSDTPRPVDALTLRGAEIGGDLDFFSSTGQATVGAEYLPAHTPVGPDGDKATSAVHGRLIGTSLRVRGRTVLSGLRCHHDILFDLCDLEGGVQAGLLSTGGRLLVRGDLHLTQCTIRGSLDVSGGWIGGDFFLCGTRLDGSITARTSRTPSGRRQHLTVVGQFDLSGTQAEDVVIEGAEIGLFRMITGEVERLWLLPGIEEAEEWLNPSEQALLDWGGSAQVAADDPDAIEPGRWRLRRCEFGGLRIQNATFAHAIYLSGVKVREEKGTPEPGVAIISQVSIRGSAQFFIADPAEVLTDAPRSALDWDGGEAPSGYALRTEFPGDLDLRSLEASDHLDLSNVLAGGRIGLKDSKVGLDLLMMQAGPNVDSETHRTRTTCCRLDIEALTCDGDADLTGLDVVPSDEEGAPDADVHARRLRVGGKLLFSAPLGAEPHDYGKISEDPAQRLDARIHGMLDLATAEAAHLVISGDSFRHPAPDRGISFERARFGRFQIVDPLPASYDLSNLTVDRWEIPRTHLFEFLDGAVPFQRSTYLALERSLRNDGDDETADEVYRGMRRKAIDELDPTAGERTDRGLFRRGARRATIRWRAIRWRLFGLATGWGTQNFRPLMVGALLLPLSIAIFSRAENVTASLEARGADPSTGIVLEAARIEPPWGIPDGVWMALRYHVPIIPLMARADFVPARTPLIIPLPGVDTRLRVWFSAEGYAYSIYLLHWIIWPLFLVGLTSRIIRARE